jgi:hypothetical protein
MEEMTGIIEKAAKKFSYNDVSEELAAIKEFENNGEEKLKEYLKRVIEEYSKLLNIDWRIK